MQHLANSAFVAHAAHARAVGRFERWEPGRLARAARASRRSWLAGIMATLVWGQAARAGEPAAVRISSTQLSPASARETQSSWQPLQVAGVVTGGVGLVLLGVSSVFAVHATNLNEDSKAPGGCDDNDECSVKGLEQRNDAIDAAQAASWTLLAGGLLTVTGTTLFLVGGTATGARANPVLGPGEARLVVEGWF